MSSFLVIFVVFCFANVVHLQGTGSGTNGNLRLCLVEGRGSYKRSNRHCPTLDSEKSGVECVIGTDRLDCLRRIHKGTVDFGAFSPEDLIAAQWADVDVLVTNEIKLRKRPFARSIVAIVNRRILQDGLLSVSALLRNTTLCHPSPDVDDLRPLSEAVVRYLESLLTVNSCDPELSLTENRVKATAKFFGKACMAGPWVPHSTRDAELKRRYPSLCAACASDCSKKDRYWGDSGALTCIADNIGDVTWAELDDVKTYFKNIPNKEDFVYLCRDGTAQLLESHSPCVWVQQPWNVIVAKRKAAEEVSALTASFTNSSVTVDGHWHAALAALLEIHQELPPPLHPAQAPMDFLSTAIGFREAYSQHGCDPPRHVTLCTTSVLESNKCEWLGEAGAVYGVAPPLQCARRSSTEECMKAVQKGECDAVVADSNWLVPAKRNFTLTPILHEATPIIDKLTTISAFVRINSEIKTISDLRGKKAVFPSFDGIAWHSVLRYLTNITKTPCKDVANTFFSSICAPGIEKYDVPDIKKAQLTSTCYKDGDRVLSGEVQALRSLVESKSDVAFISRRTYNLYRAKQIQEPWAKDIVDLIPICPEENSKFCFVSWSSIGHVFASSNLTSMKRNEILTVLTKLEQLFGNHAHKLMFSMYGPFNHQLDVLFHNDTKVLDTDALFKRRPYSDIPLNFEKSLNLTDICKYSDFITGFGVKMTPIMSLIIILVSSLMLLR